MDDLIYKIYTYYGQKRLLTFLEDACKFGGDRSYKLGISFSLFDLQTPKSKPQIVKKGFEKQLQLFDLYKTRKISKEQFYLDVIGE